MQYIRLVNLQTTLLFAQSMPYDLYCPSMSSKLPNCYCNVCGKLFPNKTRMKKHRTALHPRQKAKREFSSVMPTFGWDSWIYWFHLYNNSVWVMFLSSKYYIIKWNGVLQCNLKRSLSEYKIKHGYPPTFLESQFWCKIKNKQK